jgi:hypothetical protein
VAVCVGPTGGGKSTESFRRPIRIAQWQHPSPRDGIRKARVCVVAPTYRRIWDQVLPSYFKVIDRGWGEFRGARGDPADHVVDFEMAGLGRCHLEVMFRAVGDMDLEEFYRGLEVTAFHYPEMDTHETGDILSPRLQPRRPLPRARRPPGRGAGPADRLQGLLRRRQRPGDRPLVPQALLPGARDGDRLYEQPPGFDPTSPDGFHPQAENAHNLRKISRTFYRDQAEAARALGRGAPAAQPARLFPPRPAGAPALRQRAHGPGPHIQPDPHAELVIGMDAGSNTLMHAAAFMQRTFLGQTRTLDEVVPEGSPTSSSSAPRSGASTRPASARPASPACGSSSTRRPAASRPCAAASPGRRSCSR